MFQDIIEKLKDTEQEIKDLKRDKAQTKQFLALIMHQLGEVEVDMNKLYKVDYEKVKITYNDENRMEAKVIYQKA